MNSSGTRILNFGSLNIDHVYRVQDLVRPGETIASREYRKFPGGKGANQSVALVRAGAQVVHAGAVGPEGSWLVELLQREKIDTRFIQLLEEPTGHAVIQVDRHGENSIIIFGGANRCLREETIVQALDTFDGGNWLLLQNETNAVDLLLDEAYRRNYRICFNPAPLQKSTALYPLSKVEILMVNQTEGEALTGKTDPEAILTGIQNQYRIPEVVLTLGSQGALVLADSDTTHIPGVPTTVRDTTAAGDTFVGFYLKERSEGVIPERAADKANRAAALSVSREGAIPSIPLWSELDTS